MATTDTKEKVIRSIKTVLGATVYLIEPSVGHRFFRYQPNKAGEDSFSYRIQQSGQQDTATVKIIVKEGVVIPPEVDEKKLLNESLDMLMKCMTVFMDGTPGTDALANILDITEGQTLENSWMSEVFDDFDSVFDSNELSNTGKFDVKKHAGTYIYGDGIGSVGNPDISNQLAVYKDLASKTASEIDISKKRINDLNNQITATLQYTKLATAARQEAETIFSNYNKTMELVKTDKATITKIEELGTLRTSLMEKSIIPGPFNTRILDPKVLKEIADLEANLEEIKASTADDKDNLAMADKLKADYELKNQQYLDYNAKTKENTELATDLEKEKSRYDQLMVEYNGYVSKLQEFEKQPLPQSINWLKKDEPTDRFIVQFPSSRQSIKNDAQFEITSYYYTEAKLTNSVIYLPVSAEMSLSINGKPIMNLSVSKIEYHVQADYAFPITAQVNAYIAPYELSLQLDNKSVQELKVNFEMFDTSSKKCNCEISGMVKLAHSDFSKMQATDITIPKSELSYNNLSLTNLGGIWELMKLDTKIDQAMADKLLNVDVLYDGKQIADLYFDASDEQLYVIYSDKSKENVSKRFEELFAKYIGTKTTLSTAKSKLSTTVSAEPSSSWVGEFIKKEVLTAERKEKLIQAFVVEKK